MVIPLAVYRSAYVASAKWRAADIPDGTTIMVDGIFLVIEPPFDVDSEGRTMETARTGIGKTILNRNRSQKETAIA